MELRDRAYELYKPWVIEILNKEVPDSGNKTTHSSSIFRVPQNLLDVRKRAFLPESFCFGPFRDDEDRIWDLKLRHLPRLFRVIFGDINGSKTDQDIDESRSHFLRDMIDLVGKAYECYDGHCYEDGVNAFRAMVVDGCFIVEMLRSHDERKQLDARGDSSGSPIFDERWQLPSLQRDLIKLQNQMPLSVLKKLFSKTASGNDETPLQDLIVTFFCSMLSLDKDIYKINIDTTKDYADLFRSSFISHEGSKNHKIFINNQIFIYSAQDLQEAGVAFIRKEKSTLLDISFDSNKGVLQIPPLSINEDMLVTLLNFVAYEQCDQSKKPYFINYLLFLDGMINTTRDVEILRKNRIIWYTLGREKEVVDFFNNFCKTMLFSVDQTCLSVDMDAINTYCKRFYENKWDFWWSNLKRERFSNPWTFLSLVAAIILLILTMLQTFFTIFPYYHPN